MIVPSKSAVVAEVVPIHRTPRRRAASAAATIVASLALAVLGAGCGGSHNSGSARSSAASKRGFATALAYSRCMRSHGLPAFPDPTTRTAGGHRELTININAGSGVNPADPAFQAANNACRSLLPAGVSHTEAVSSKQLADELQWSSCLRSHGLPGFPDPNSHGAFAYSQIAPYIAKFNAQSPLVIRAARACKSYQPQGSVPALAG